jgi:hypothetical protein
MTEKENAPARAATRNRSETENLTTAKLKG